MLSLERNPIVTTFGDDYKRDKNGKVMYHYYIDGKVASKSDCDHIRKVLYNTLKLEESVSLSDLDAESFDEMKDYLKKHSN